MFSGKITVTGDLIRREQLNSASVSSPAGSLGPPHHAHSRARAKPGVRWGLIQAFLAATKQPTPFPSPPTLSPAH